jgi:alpha-L-fucosidase
MFIHWGIYSVNATGRPSWSMMALDEDQEPSVDAYFAQAERFDPDDYDPDRWLAAAKRAGMEYAVLTTKHHDGFALWPSEYGEFSTAEYCDGRDFVGEYVDACRRHGVKVGFYFSLPDWHHPNWPAKARETYDGLQAFTDETNLSYDADDVADLEEYYQYVQGQLRELLTRYGNIDLLWYDTPGHFWSGVNEDRIGDLYDLARTLQPHIIVNGRGRHAHWGDYQTPENELPDEPIEGWWELCDSLGGSWGFQDDDEYRGVDWALERLAETVSGGGNLLLNVGPKADGTLPTEVHDRLEALAAWMENHEPAVKGVEAGPRPPRCDVPVTQGDATWYLHVPQDHGNQVELSDVLEPRDVRLLRNGTQPEYGHADRTLSVGLPAHETPCEVVAVSWDGTTGPTA